MVWQVFNVKWGVAQRCCSFPSILKAQQCKSHNRNVLSLYCQLLSQAFIIDESRCIMILGKVPVSQWLEIMKSYIKLLSCYVPIMIYCAHYDILITCKHINYNLLKQKHAFLPQKNSPFSPALNCLYFPKIIKILSYDKHMLTVTIYSSSSRDYVNFCCHLVRRQMLHPIKSM